MPKPSHYFRNMQLNNMINRKKCRNFKATEANKRRGLGTREKVSSGRINLQSNTYVHGSKTRNLPV
jgi:hypothetical protein